MALKPDQPMWSPSATQIASANMTAFRREAERRSGLSLPDYQALWRWSVDDIDGFWSLLWDFCGVVAETKGDRVLVDGDKMPGARFFPDARLNYAENLLRRRDDATAIVFNGEGRVRRTVSYRELYDMVSRVASALRASGIGPGDRVAGYLPNLPEAIVFLLAAASIGAIWSSASPDFGVQGVLDRFGQIEPKLLVTTDGYFYGGKAHDVRGKVLEILPQLPTVQRTVLVPYVDPQAGPGDLPDAVTFSGFIDGHDAGDIPFAQLPFDHPLYILYSSGTTGVPKCIVHGAGGALLQHLKEHRLHSDVKAGDRVFYFTTLGWMMWNWLVSALASEATVLLYDGNPFHPDGRALWDFADETGMTLFGTSAKYIDALNKAGVRPLDSNRLEALRVITSTASPLVPESFDFVYSAIKPDVQLSSMSGGTDLVSCFILGNPTAPVWRGELQCAGLGMAVAVYDDEGRPVTGTKGELVCTRPFPPMPVCFWNDPDGARYRHAYFERFPGVWHHGDYLEATDHGGLVIHGRSDATLNPGGVRIGTAEIYRQVEQLDEVVESLVIGQAWDNDVRVVLFVRLREGLVLDDDLIKRIRGRIRSGASPRHVPAKVVQVADIPRTKSGKITELAVRDVVHGQAVKNVEALANPDALKLFRGLEELGR